MLAHPLLVSSQLNPLNALQSGCFPRVRPVLAVLPKLQSPWSPHCWLWVTTIIPFLDSHHTMLSPSPGLRKPRFWSENYLEPAVGSQARDLSLLSWEMEIMVLTLSSYRIVIILKGNNECENALKRECQAQMIAFTSFFLIMEHFYTNREKSII